MVHAAERVRSTHLRLVSCAGICLIAISLLLGLSGAGLASGGIQEDPKPDALPSQTPSEGMVNENPEKRPRPPELDVTTWGLVTAPVHGTSLLGPYRGAELFAGPYQFGSYFAAVLPNGRVVKPAGVSTQVGMNPLGVVLTSDGKYLITSNDDELDPGFQSYRDPMNYGCYSLSVIDTSTMQLVSTWPASPEASWPTNVVFIGLQVTGSGPYTLWASGGGDNDVKIFSLSTTGVISPSTTPPNRIPITPITPDNEGFVTNYALTLTNLPLIMFSGQQNGARATWPAGSVLSRNGRFLYVACNSDNSVAVIDTIQKAVVKRVAVGYFPYGVSLSDDDQTVTVSNWGVSEYKFANATYDPVSHLATVLPVPGNMPDGFYVPVTDSSGVNPKTSSISILNAPGGDGSQLSLVRSVYQGHPLDALNTVGDTHPSATAILEDGHVRVLYVTKTNSDRLGVIDLTNGQSLVDIDLSPVKVHGVKGNDLVGAYPNAIVVSPDKRRMYVAEAGINSVAVLDTTNPFQPKLLGRMPTGWYPTALTLSADGRFLYVANAKGVGTDINPKINTRLLPSPPSGLGSDPNTDSHCVFGTVQKIDLTSTDPRAFDVLANNFSIQKHADSSVVPIGGQASGRIKHVFFILQENKTFDSMLGGMRSHFGPYASMVYNNRDGSEYPHQQFNGVTVNMQLLARTFATGVNYYSDSEESTAGHEFCASGTCTDYTEKTLFVPGGRGFLLDGFNPEELPENGYIFNNIARNGLGFKVFGDPTLIDGSDSGVTSIYGSDGGITSKPILDDPTSGNFGYPALAAGFPPGIPPLDVSNPLYHVGDVDSITQGLGESFYLRLPMLAVLGGKNTSGEPRIDLNFPGFNLNISDQRRAKEFIRDFDRMVSQGTLPQYVHIWIPNSHTGPVATTKDTAPLITNGPVQQVADGDVAVGMIVEHIMKSPVYFDAATGEGSAIFMTFDDAQSTLDHIHPYRTPLIVVSPYAKPGYVARRHYSTASIVKTEELLLGLPPNNLGDLFATDLRDLFQGTYNNIKASDVAVTRIASYAPSEEGKRIWSLAEGLDVSGIDRDSFRLGALARLSISADDLHGTAKGQQMLKSRSYKAQQARLYESALKIVSSNAPRHNDRD